ncbi:MAG: hypothetical protein ACKVX7_00100 [Planctomycetota bacterium]
MSPRTPKCLSALVVTTAITIVAVSTLAGGGKARAAGGGVELVMQLRASFDANATWQFALVDGQQPRMVRLKDVAAPVADSTELWSEVAELRIALEPCGVLTRGAIERRLVRAGLPLGSFRIDGAPVCCAANSRKGAP